MGTNNVDKKIDEQIKGLLDVEKEVYEDDDSKDVIIDRKYDFSSGDTKKVDKIEEIEEIEEIDGDNASDIEEEEIKTDIIESSNNVDNVVNMNDHDMKNSDDDDSLFDDILLLVVIVCILFVFVFLFLFFS